MERPVVLHIVYIGDEYNAERRLLNICNSRARLAARVKNKGEKPPDFSRFCGRKGF